MDKRLRLPAAGAAFAAALAVGGCDDWLEVTNPSVIDASTVDPVEDAPTFSQSALNNLFDAFDNVIVYGAWFSGEAWEGDTFPTRTDIARRNIDFVEGTGTLNGTVNDDIYFPLARAIATGERVQELLAGEADAASNIDIARAAFASGYAILLEAETLCTVVISSGLDNMGSPLTPEEGAAQAEARLRRVIEIAGASSHPHAAGLVMAARVGLARALLFQDEHAEAASVAAQVPAGFVLMAPKVDDPSNRAALANTVFNSFTLGRPSLVVPPYFRALNDDRIGSELGPDPTWPLVAQDGFLQFFRQTKHDAYEADVRLASGLEARYIAAEAQLKSGNAGPAQALIAERQAAGGPDAVFQPSGDTLTDLLDQKVRDFYLEGQYMGDWRRNPNNARYVPGSGTAYYNPLEGGVFGTDTCIPLPDDEVLNNPNFS